ncbi:MAG: DNA-directed RNA polymerase [Pseudomonadota bacterium]
MDARVRDPLFEAQRDRELEALRSAKERYEALQRETIETQGASALSGYQKLIRGAHRGTVEVLEAWVEDCLEAKGRSPAGLLPIRSLGLNEVALIGLTFAIDAVHAGKEPRDICLGIGEALQEELWVEELFDKDKKLWGRLFPRIKREGSNAKQRLRGAKRMATKLDPKHWRKWDLARCLRIGEPVLNAILMGSGIVEITPGDPYKRLQLTEDAREWLLHRDETLCYRDPKPLPMVHPPRPWRGMEKGPFLTPSMNKKFPLVRTRSSKHRRAVARAIAEGTMDKTLDALNAINATPWRINERVMEAVQWVWDMKLQATETQFSGLEKFPKSFLMDVPGRLDPQKATDDEVKDNRHERGVAIEFNREAEGGALQFVQDMETARELKEYPSFYLPHNLDFRGRIYPIPHFNQQRTDYVKGMIEFSEGKPLGHKGAYWLAIHLANCGDFDKISKRPLRERYNWVLDNRHMIKEIADDYTSNLIWLEADKPFQFLSACIEWAAYLDQGPSYRSRCAVALDGTNSGLQHYSAALRAEQDAFYVNLRDVEEGQDIYRAVADRCAAYVKELLGTGDVSPEEREIAQQWLDHGIDRKVVKRSVMTFPYSSETFGFADQLKTDLMKPYTKDLLRGARTSHPFGEDRGYKAANFLAKLIWRAVNEVVARAGEGMAYFKKVASVMAHEGQALQWETPCGLPIIHEYREMDVKRIELRLYDRKIHTVTETGGEDLSGFLRVVYNMQVRPTERIKKSKQRSAVAPNVIHSMDASHMKLTVLKAREEGITAFSLIHDSFATHAADTDRFFLIIRETFAQMYEEYDVFQVIDDYAREVLSPKGAQRLPPLPSMGSLDLNEVIRSQFAFS